MISFTFFLLSLSDLLCNIHFTCAVKLFCPSTFPPVNVAANDEYLNFDQDSIYAIVSTTTGKALNI
ncbi:hypothetical protein, partial [Finegoldia magna]|uniref:hypothetical protein n=1 Tax=Finegoldia magna TaxID=1260 RepID=UPI0029048901